MKCLNLFSLKKNNMAFRISSATKLLSALRTLDIHVLCRLSPMFYKGDNYYVCLHAYRTPSEKVSTLNGKNLHAGIANSFFLRVDPFSEGESEAKTV